MNETENFIEINFLMHLSIFYNTISSTNFTHVMKAGPEGGNRYRRCSACKIEHQTHADTIGFTMRLFF